MTAHAVTSALASLVASDQVLAGLADRHGRPRGIGRKVPVADRFAVLVRSVLSQQLAAPAARAIHARLLDRLSGEVTPSTVLKVSDDELRACGLSGSKAGAIQELASRASDGRLRLDRMGRMSDAAVIAHMVQAKGIGTWTAQMFLMNALGRLDIWPVDDLGVRVGYGFAWGLREAPSPKELSDVGNRFRPHRSIVAWYCWRAADERAASLRAVPAVGAASSR